MKKVLALVAMTTIGLTTLQAQDVPSTCAPCCMSKPCSLKNSDFYGLGNHVGVSVGAGLTGITIDAATCLTPYVGVRAGVDIFPNIKIGTELDLEFDNSMKSQYETLSGQSLPSKIDVEGKTSMTTGHILFDIHPFKTGFRITAGAYFGGSEIISVYNKEDGALQTIYDYNHSRGVFAPLADNHPGMIGLALGDYFIEPTEQGNAEATLKVNGFRPYLGIGFGHSVPKNRIGFQFDLGVQFWGSPKVYVQDKQLTEQSTNGEDGGVIKTISKVSVYPCMSFRLTGRIL